MCLLMVVILFVGCENGENDNTGPVHLLTLSVEDYPVYLYGSLENWVIIYDEQGGLIDARKFERGTEVVIDTDKPLSGSTIGVTLLRYFNDSVQQWRINSYLQVAVGSKFTMRNEPSTPMPNGGASIGTFDIHVTGSDETDEFMMTNKFGESYLNGEWYTGYLAATCPISQNAHKTMVMLADKSAGDIRYKFFEDVKAGDVFNLSYTDMFTFDKVYNLKFPSCSDVFVYVTGKEQDQKDGSGYTTNYHFSADTHSQIPVGYLNGLSNYYTFFQLRYANHTLTHANRGSVPTGEIQWPSPSDYSLSKKAVNDFESRAVKPFTYRKSSWFYHTPAENAQKLIFWDVFGTTEKHVFAELPAEIVAKYPDLSFENLTHRSPTFVSGTNPYTHFLETEFDGKVDSGDGMSTGIEIW